MSWNNCRPNVKHRPSHSSALFKVLLTLKLLHGSRGGKKGSTLEDIAMHMIKQFNLDGDVKSQVLATLKYGVKKHFIEKRDDKFSLVLPASSVQIAPCKYIGEEIQRVQCLFPPSWQSRSCMKDGRNVEGSCCGRRKRGSQIKICCGEVREVDDEDADEGSPCPCKKQYSQNPCSGGTCPKSASAPTGAAKRSCAFAKPPACKKKLKQMRRKGIPQDPYDNYCLLCDQDEDDENCNECTSLEPIDYGCKCYQ